MKRVSILIFIFILIFFLIYFGKAQEFYWCLETKEGKKCQPNVAQDECKTQISFIKPSECKTITCLLADGNCQEKKPELDCIKENGREALAEECIKGCCLVDGNYRGIKTRAQCDLIVNKENATLIEFYPNVKNEQACLNLINKNEIGCCVTQEKCRYRIISTGCSGQRYYGKFCSEIQECRKYGISQKAYKACGDPRLGRPWDIYWFDSNGNQEELERTCGYPEFICDICLDEKCKDEKYGFEVNKLEPYCRSTKCDLTKANGSQELEWQGTELKIKWKNPPQFLLSGQSICYNFYSGQAKSDKEVYVNGFPRRSTGLQNQILRCSWGRTLIDGLGSDRNLLCFEKPNELKTYTERNRYFLCNLCGKPQTETQKKIQELQEKIYAGEITPEIYNIEMDELEMDTSEMAKAIWFNFADSMGDFYKSGEKLVFGFSWIFAEPFYAIGGEACDEKSCKAIGNFSNGESHCVFISKSGGLSGIVGRTAWSPVDASCVPRYPSGYSNKCGLCGYTGDIYFDTCTSSEAWALGNCQFEEYSFGTKSIYYLWNLPQIALSIKFNLILLYPIVDAIQICLGSVIPNCFGIIYLQRLKHEIKEAFLVQGIVQTIQSLFTI